MPVARVVSPVTHANWEGKGVQPDVVVPAREALDVATQRLQPAAKPVPRA
jgi:DNA-binding protein H-NS